MHWLIKPTPINNFNICNVITAKIQFFFVSKYILFSSDIVFDCSIMVLPLCFLFIQSCLCLMQFKLYVFFLFTLLLSHFPFFNGLILCMYVYAYVLLIWKESPPQPKFCAAQNSESEKIISVQIITENNFVHNSYSILCKKSVWLDLYMYPDRFSKTYV